MLSARRVVPLWLWASLCASGMLAVMALWLSIAIALAVSP